MRMDGALQNYMLVAHTPVDHGELDLRMGVMLKIVGDRQKTEGYVAHYMANLKAGFEDDIRIWENKLYREQPGALRRRRADQPAAALVPPVLPSVEEGPMPSDTS